ARLDGAQTGDAARAAYEECFGEPLSEDDLQEFVALAEVSGFLETADGPTPAGAGGGTAGLAPAGVGSAPPAQAGAPGVATALARVGRGLLYWRCRLFGPDRLLSRLEPKIRFFWTRTFLAASAAGILAAFVFFCLNWHEVTRS